MAARRFTPRRLSLGLLALLGVLVLSLLAVGTWLWRSDAALSRLVPWVPGLEVQGQQGRLTGGPFSLQRLQWQGAGVRVVVEDLTWDDADWVLRPHAGAWFSLQLEAARAARVQVFTLPAPTPAPTASGPPTSLRIPLELQAPGLQVGRFTVDDQAPVTDLAADLHLGANAGAEHRVAALSLRRDALVFSGQATVSTAGDLPVRARFQVGPAQPAAPDWRADVHLVGPLQQLQLGAQFSHTGGAQARADATLAPFAAWPLRALNARADKLDLSTLAAGLPQTALSGQAWLSDPPQAGQVSAAPLVLDVALTNAAPGPWDAGRLPLARLHLRVQGRPGAPDVLSVERFTADLAGTQPAGQVQGSGQLDRGTLRLQLTLIDVRPDQLAGAAPPMRLSGRLTVQVDGLPTAAAAPEAQGLQARADVDLSGRLDRAGTPPLQLQTIASLSAPPDGTLSLQLRALRASVGGSGSGHTAGSATAEASADRNPAGDWHVQSEGELARFDPGPWWPAARLGPATAAAGRQALNARWRADLTRLAEAGPAAVASSEAGPVVGATAARFVRRWRGRASLDLAPSRFAGLAWQGQASLDADAQALHVQADLQAGRNRFQLDGQWPHSTAPGPLRTAALPTGTLDIQAPALDSLAPLARLLPAGARRWWPRGGNVQVQATVAGPWPTLRTQGRLQASGLRNGPLQVGRAEADWTLSTDGGDAPWQLDLQASDVRVVGESASGEPPAGASDLQRLQQLTVKLDGSARQHRLHLRATSPARPPAWAEALAGQPMQGGSTLQLRAQGQWTGARPGAGLAAGGTWRGQVDELRAAPSRDPAQAWLAAEALVGRLRLGPGGQLLEAELAPGRLAVFGSGLNWQQATWQAGGPPAAPRLSLQAQLEPLAVAPLMARLQPQFQWRGDLRLAGRVSLRQAQTLAVDVLVEREAGDLSLQVEGRTRALQISDLRLGLTVKDGLWQATQALVGGSVGVVGGWQVARAAPQALWPGPAAGLDGGFSLLVPQLQVWAPWLPPGWRLGGELRAAATLAGTVGQPQYRGQVSGEALSVHNLFEGIHLQQGTLDVALEGRNATLRRAEFRDAVDAGGQDGPGDETPGWLRVSGRAGFGDSLTADLRVSLARLRVLDRFDRRVTASGAADLGLGPQGLRARGSFTIDEGLIDATQADAPQLGADVVVLNRVPLGPTRVEGAPGAADAGFTANAASAATPPLATDVDLRVDLGQQLRLRGRGLDTLLRGQLRVTTPGGQLAVNGVVRAEEGTYSAYGQNLRIERGNLVFRGEVATPTLDVLALRADIDERVGVVVTGSAVNPRVRLYSEPALDEFDTLTWLVLGRAPEGLGRDDTALLQRAALALLSGEGGGDSGFLQRLGLDELSLGRASNGGVNETIVSLGKQISRRVYVGYEHALGAATGTLQLIYRVANRVTLRARTGEENAVDVIWSWRWN